MLFRCLPLTVRLAAALSLAALTACSVLGDDLIGGAPTVPGTPRLAEGAIPGDFTQFVARLRPEAIKAGVPGAVYDRALAGVAPDMDVLRRASSQPEFSRKIWDYVDDATVDTRIDDGRALIARDRGLLDGIEATYGVGRQYVVAIWGMESSYGTVFDNDTSGRVKNVVRSLATLAWKGGSRSSYGRKQLFAALRILGRGDIDRAHMTGSWAGAMGHTQFIPTTYLAYAVDYDGDGHADIWRSEADALASTAAYLRRSGWRPGTGWGYEVRLPAGFDGASGSVATLGDWAARGVVRANGSAFPRPDDVGRLYLPAGRAGPAFLTLKNFDVIKRYNASDAYALSVGHLADRLAGGGPLIADWPRGYTPLDTAGRMELQGRLQALGFPIVKIDGRIGPESIAAIRSYQARNGLAVDGNASAELLTRLRSGS